MSEVRLIDAEVLKEKAETVTLWNGEVRRFVSYETIDNAPTVKERPQGELEHIPDDTNEQRVVYKCSVCGRIIDVYYREDLAVSYPFCHCGASMRKGGSNR